MKIKIRKPRITISKKGLKLTNVGASIGGKKTRLNLSRKGISATVGVPGASYNTRRGCILSPFTWLGWLLGKK